MVKTKIKINPLNQNAQSDINLCSACSDEAQWYCINDMQYFCDRDWHDIHNMKGNNGKEFFREHKKVSVDNKPKDFGFCEEHHKMFEFYSNDNSKAFCSQCIVKNVKQSESQDSTIPIEDAFKNAYDEC